MTTPEALNAISTGPQWAPRWDTEFGNRPDTDTAVQLLADLADGRPVVEFGIGTGRLALPLAARGLTVAGIDNSPAMLEQLRAKPLADKITVAEGSFADTRVGADYGLVVLADHTLFALTSQEAQIQCFENAAAHLAPGGLFTVEVISPKSGIADNGRFWTTGVGEDSLTFFVSGADHVTQQMRMCRVTITTGGEVRMRPAASRYSWPAEMDLMARIADMRLRDRWGGWDRQPFTEHSPRHVSVYQKDEPQ